MEIKFNTCELRELVEHNGGEPVAFALYKCGCDDGIMIFDSKTQTPILPVSHKSNKATIEIYDDLVRARNKLNREISKLKKVTIECRDCGKPVEEHLKDLGFCEKCRIKLEEAYQRELKPFEVLKDLEFDKKGDIVNLTPNAETTQNLVHQQVIKPITN